jgi:putative peptide zinc metalloprotease protein
MFLPRHDCALPPASAQSEPVQPTGEEVRPRGEVLRRADGIELIGEFEGSGFKNPPLLARRADGQVVQLTKLLYELAAAADGQCDTEAVADAVSRRCGRTVSTSDVAFLAERKLRPLGVLALADGTTPVLKKRPPVMALRHRKALLSERAVNAGAWVFTCLHAPFVQAPLLLVLVGFDAWLFGMHGVAGGLRSVLYNPVLLLAVFASVIVATAFHEFGHASACRYGGARPGAMGVGVYLVWPVFYCDVTDAYRLNRAGRLRTDLGGIYFNALFALLAGAVYFYTGEQAALLAAFVQHLLILQQLIPLMRFDGYYVVTDLTGVPDILSRIKPIFRSLLRGREHVPQVAELKPWVRWVATIYLVALVPALALLFVWMLIGMPRLIATAWRAFALQVDLFGRVGLAEMAASAVRTLMLALELGAMAVSIARVGRMASRPVLGWSRGSVPRSGALALAAAALLAAVAFIWWPQGGYRPIQPGERGTVQEGLNSLTNLASRAGQQLTNFIIPSPADTGGGVSGTAPGARGTASGGSQTTTGARSGAAGATATGAGTTPTTGTTTTTGSGTTTTSTGNGTTTTGVGTTQSTPTPGAVPGPTTSVPGSPANGVPSTSTTGTGTTTTPTTTTTTTGTGTTTTSTGTGTTTTSTGTGTTTSPTTTTTGTGTTTSSTTTGAGTTTSPTTTTGTTPTGTAPSTTTTTSQ